MDIRDSAMFLEPSQGCGSHREEHCERCLENIATYSCPGGNLFPPATHGALVITTPEQLSDDVARELQVINNSQPNSPGLL